MVAILASALLLSHGLHGQDAPLPHQTFEKDAGGWTVTGTFSPNSKVSVSHDAAHLKVGGGSLQFDYTVAKGETNILTLPIADGGLAKMKSMKFWVQTDYPTTICVLLSEKGGCHYMARFTAPKGQWQRAELGLTDFTLNTGPSDPKDPDNKLDPDQIESVAVFDLDELLAQGDANFAALFKVVTGSHAIYLSDFQASSETLPDVTAGIGSEVGLDSYARPQVQWIAVGGPSLSLSSGKPLEGPALKEKYHVDIGGLEGVVRSIALNHWAGATQLTFKVASEKAVKIMVQLEESDGGKYNAIAEVPGGSVVKQVDLQFKDLKPSDDSKDTNGKLDPELINQVLVVDLTGMMDQVGQDNTLWIGKITARK